MMGDRYKLFSVPEARNIGKGLIKCAKASFPCVVVAAGNLTTEKCRTVLG
jgi:hypothetical protein